MLIEAVLVSKTYPEVKGQVLALKEINIRIFEGEYVAITGPSGAGKSTLLHILCGLDRPTQGAVFFEGKSLADFSDNALSLWRNRTIGFVFQFYHLIEELTCLENVILPTLVFSKRKRKSSLKDAEKLLKYLGIEEKTKVVPSQLSGGEKQRVAIARALINNPKVVFCDEPTGNLDKASAEEVMRLLKYLHTQGRTVVVATHNLSLAKQAERIIKLEGGRIIEI